jgi:hypothetical protein
MRDRELRSRLRRLERRLAVAPFAQARADWLAEGRWPIGKVRDQLLDLEQLLVEMQLCGSIDASKRREVELHARAIEAAKNGDLGAETLVLELAREREARRPNFAT